MFHLVLLLSCCLSAPGEVTVAGGSITLGSLIPFPEGDVRAGLTLGQAPDPGLARRIFKRDILFKLRQASLALDDLNLPESILVRRRSQTIDPNLVESAAVEALSAAYPGANIEIFSFEAPEAQVAEGPLEFTVYLPPGFDPSAPVYLRVSVGGPGFQRSLFVRAGVRIEKPQPVFRASLPANSAIREQDVEWKLMPVQSSSKVVTSLESLDGMLTKRPAAQGEVLSADLLYSPLHVKKGDAVTVRAAAGRVSVAATMRAKSSGKYGDSIVVEHVSGGGTATARIVGPRLLEIIAN